MTRLLFLVKRGSNYGSYSYSKHSSGLLNSVKFVVEMLNDNGIEARFAEVIDNNDIDREVHRYRPSHVIIEALWVVPEKFEVLRWLHPRVKWIVRIHSNTPFIATEGVAVDWLIRYARMAEVFVAANSKKALHDLRTFLPSDKLVYLPNYYNLGNPVLQRSNNHLHLNVACFGAIRPLKNQLIQAIAAIRYAESRGRLLFFHINATRCEQEGSAVLKNLRSLFLNSPHYLIEHKWHTHHQFLGALRNMDIGMQVSLSETFNIVSADYVKAGLPIVVSPEIGWAAHFSKAKATDSEDIVAKLREADGLFRSVLYQLNVSGLKSHDRESRKQWLSIFG